jgi:2-methylcitrate dehydratase PrpD
MSAPTLCEQLAEHVVSLKFEAIHKDASERAKAIILHDLAIAFGGLGTDQVDKALALIGRRAGTATLLGQPFKVAAADAAFVNTVATRALRMEDMALPSQCHPGACLVPTALALAEECEASGPEVLAAVVLGYDVIGKVAGPVYSNQHCARSPSHVFLALGIAATAARLMRLDWEQTTGALAHACNLGAMISEGIHDFQYGVLTHNGMFAARLGKCRAPFPADALESPIGLYAVQLGGARPTTAEIVGELGTRFEITTTILKPHPCTGINLVALEMLRHLRLKHRLTAGNVRRLTVRRASVISGEPTINAPGPFSGYLGGMYQASSSLPFGMAAVLADGEVTRAHFSNPNDPRLAALMPRVNIEFQEHLGLLDNELVIETQDGERIELRGGEEFLRAPDPALILEQYARQHIGERKIRELREQVERLDRLGDVRELTRCLA